MQHLLLLLLLCVCMAPYNSLRLAFPAQPGMTDSRTNSSLPSLELSIIEAQRGSTEQQERRSERATDLTASSQGTAPPMNPSSPRPPKGRRAGRRRGDLPAHQSILRPRSEVPTGCFDGFLDGLYQYAAGRKKGSSWHSAKAFSAAAAAFLILVIALQDLVSSPEIVGTADERSTAVQQCSST